MIITSAQNPRIKNALRLRERRGRKKQGRSIIDGQREIQQAVSHQTRIVELFVCYEQCRSVEEARRIVSQVTETGAEVFETTPRILEKLSFGNRSEGIVAIFECELPGLEEVAVTSCPLIAVLDGIEKPGNVGALFRSADAAGVDAVIVTEGGTDLFNPNAIRASLGTVFALPAFRTTAPAALQWLESREVQILAADTTGTLPFHQADFTRPTAIVLGAEAEGLSDLWFHSSIERVCLPMMGSADSLNVSVTAAVLFYEALRQRSSQPGDP